MSERYFYHSFRRLRPGEDAMAAKVQAASILDAIQKIGLPDRFRPT
jgi:hypothetical protein